MRTIVNFLVIASAVSIGLARIFAVPCALLLWVWFSHGYLAMFGAIVLVCIVVAVMCSWSWRNNP
jgi:hypothetical protein